MFSFVEHKWSVQWSVTGAETLWPWHVGTFIDHVDIIHGPGFHLKQRFGDWILSPASGKTLLILA
jgi:hypothetical protein